MRDIALTTPTTSATTGNLARGGGRLKQLRGNITLTIGLLLLVAILVFCAVGRLFVNPADAIVGAVPTAQAPSAVYPLGTDSQGRDMLTIMILGTPQTLRIGLIAGVVGIAIGLCLGLIAGYFGGPIDTVIRVLSDSLSTIPGIAILLIIAVNIGHMTIELMGLTVAALAWMHPARAIRAQVLSIRERPYVDIAAANGEGGMEIVFREVMPNLLPYIAATFVGAVSSAMLASVGLEALGLGTPDVHTLGTTIYWAQKYSAVLRGLWWWYAPPIAMIAFIVVGLFCLSIGIDRIVNPRLRKQT